MLLLTGCAFFFFFLFSFFKCFIYYNGNHSAFLLTVIHRAFQDFGFLLVSIIGLFFSKWFFGNMLSFNGGKVAFQFGIEEYSLKATIYGKLSSKKPSIYPFSDTGLLYSSRKPSNMRFFTWEYCPASWSRKIYTRQIFPLSFTTKHCMILNWHSYSADPTLKKFDNLERGITSQGAPICSLAETNCLCLALWFWVRSSNFLRSDSVSECLRLTNFRWFKPKVQR